ncbi:tyrosine-type recombinase/integrase [Candidatus Poriferisodalis sp.]|uniref:tyrosine-type recombinase/integrase n=1 Tax=Candidatus Poriferisodalis sp. TaxID=3101277 RepID=UPI003AF9CEE6
MNLDWKIMEINTAADAVHVSDESAEASHTGGTRGCRQCRVPMGESSENGHLSAEVVNDAGRTLRRVAIGGGQLTPSGRGILSRLAEHEVAASTLRSYHSQWTSFLAWTAKRDLCALPAEPALVAAYLADRMERLGHKPATLRVAAAAIAYIHDTFGFENPCAHPDVKRTLKGATRIAGGAQKQAKGLTAEALDEIMATARRPRVGRGGRRESAHAADRRGRLDIALVSLMRDAMLRVSEAAALTWGDIETELDGSGRLLIRRSKADPTGEGAVAFVSAQTMTALESIRDDAHEGLGVFGLRPNQISLRIKKAAIAAGLGEGYSGHSARVGMAQDLVRAGIELPGLMTAGRWRSPTMPAHYTRNETAGRGAVAQFYGYRRNSSRAVPD